MEINNLLNEASQGYKVMQADSEKLASKWTASGLLEGLEAHDKNNMAMILENQAKQIVAEANTTGTSANFSAGQGEQWAGVALPMVRKVFAQIAAKDFVSVQPMNLPSGLVFYLDFKYGNDNGVFEEGKNLYGDVSTAGDKMTIADGDATGGLYGAGRFGYSINTVATKNALTAIIDNPATAASVNFNEAINHATKEEAHVVITDLDEPDLTAIRSFVPTVSGVDAAGLLPEFTRIQGNSIAFIVNIGVGATIDAVNYSKQPADNSRGDFEADSSAVVDNSIVIPTIDVKLASEAIVAKTRKLKAQWTPEFAQDLNAYHSIDAEAELTSMLSEYISMEIDLEILDMLITDAATEDYWSAENNKVWSNTANAGKGGFVDSNADFYNTQGQWFQTLGTKIQKVSNKIHQKTLRGGANFLVCSPTVATVLESIPGYAASTDGDKLDFAFGVQKVGSLNGRYKVYKNPYMTENQILMGYRGSQFLETGAVYAPYVPLMMTPLVYDPDTFTPRKGLMTRYAKKMIRPEFYGKIKVNGLTTI